MAGSYLAISRTTTRLKGPHQILSVDPYRWEPSSHGVRRRAVASRRGLPLATPSSNTLAKTRSAQWFEAVGSRVHDVGLVPLVGFVLWLLYGTVRIRKGEKKCDIMLQYYHVTVTSVDELVRVRRASNLSAAFGFSNRWDFFLRIRLRPNDKLGRRERHHCEGRVDLTLLIYHDLGTAQEAERHVGRTKGCAHHWHYGPGWIVFDGTPPREGIHREYNRFSDK
jgi:hypothetical protein